MKGLEFEIPGGKHSFAHSIACIAFADEFRVENVPIITDSQTLCNLLKYIFDWVNLNTKTHILHLKGPKNTQEIEIDADLLSQSRNIFCLLPALLNRSSCLRIKGVPKGCDIGERPTDWYYQILMKFGVEITNTEGELLLTWPYKKAAKIELEYPTMTGTVIALGCATICSGISHIQNGSLETSCFETLKCMKALGVLMSGDLPNLTIQGGVKKKKGIYVCISDRVYAVTMLTAAVLAEQSFSITSKEKIDISKFIEFLKSININVESNGNRISVGWKCDKPLKPICIEAGSEPKFSSDWVTFALLILATKSKGQSQITDDVFPKRFQFINHYLEPHFKNVNVKIGNRNGRKVAIASINGTGKNKILGGDTHYCPDIRGTASMVLSAILADNPVQIRNEFQLKRGYENLIGTLEQIGFIKKELS